MQLSYRYPETLSQSLLLRPAQSDSQPCSPSRSPAEAIPEHLAGSPPPCESSSSQSPARAPEETTYTSDATPDTYPTAKTCCSYGLHSAEYERCQPCHGSVRPHHRRGSAQPSCDTGRYKRSQDTSCLPNSPEFVPTRFATPHALLCERHQNPNSKLLPPCFWTHRQHRRPRYLS